jgi:MoxR-like ATPase
LNQYNINELSKQDIDTLMSKLGDVSNEVSKVIVGQREVIDELLIGILAGGHCLLEGVPGLAKTLMVSSLAKTMELDFHRVQFTPDLMPSDIVGTEILEEDHGTGKRVFQFQKGPVFTNILLADEINRTPPKTQAALLEAMQEKRVSFAGETHQLPKPFFVLATQNPVEQSGTYPLPEAQLDRFLLYIRVNYPTAEDEIEILRRTTGTDNPSMTSVLKQDDLILLQSMTRSVEISDDMMKLIATIVRATRPGETGIDFINQYIRWGAGPRAGQAMVLCAKAKALLDGRYSVVENDINFIAPAVLRHRILLKFEAEAENLTADDLIRKLVDHCNG